MITEEKKVEQNHYDELYADIGSWHVNTGAETIHAKRMPGRFRSIKWMTSSLWLLLFLGPYLRWHGSQAILWDIPARKFHIFGITVMPQDIWMLSLVLTFFAILLAVVTSVAGRIFCGYFCFQTAWTDLFTWIEEKLEGNPTQRRKLDKEPLSLNKLKVKIPKHAAWLVISMLTGVSFAAWFTDAYQLWPDLFTLQANPAAYAVVGLFTVGTYVLAGYMREQVCFWLCPYARIQGVMADTETIMPAYDARRGEPRGKLKKDGQEPGRGSCIDCGQCVAVCPTGIDIREGQQEGCITCGLCIDACDSVMEKVGMPKGLVRYASLDELEGQPTIPLFKRPRVLVYIGIMTTALLGIIYGLSHLSGIELKVLHERQPLYIQQSDGAIMNKYYLKVLNKTDKPLTLDLSVAEAPEGLVLTGLEGPLVARAGEISKFTVFARVPKKLKEESAHVDLVVRAQEDPSLSSEYETQFFGPR